MTHTPKHVVAIGASAGGLLPLQELIENLPPNLTDTCIVIAQHLSPEYKSMLAEIISRKTTMPTATIVDGAALEANHIYVTPPNCDVVFVDDRIDIVETTIGGPRPNVDRLFTSLAKVYKQQAVAIILSGTGADGSNGIIEVKQQGGITICQDPATAKYTGMPSASIATEKVDHVLSATTIGAELVNLLQNEYEQPAAIPKQKAEATANDVKNNNGVNKLLNLLEIKTGTNFNNYKSSTILRRIEKRLKDLNIPNVKQYLKYIEKNDDELDAFFGYLLIGVTSFFRDTEAFDALKQILTTRVQAKPPNTSIRVWIPGCATGEESVSLAIVLLEIIRDCNRFDLKIQVFATDINKTAISFARRGIYEKDKIEMMPENIVSRYFSKNGEHYETSLPVRNSIIYTQHDITSNPPFLRMDFISCRNLFIYFNQHLQNQLFPMFHYALAGEGILFMGKSESIGNYKVYFETLDPKYRIFLKKDVDNRNIVNIAGNKRVIRAQAAIETPKMAVQQMTVQEMVKETLYTNYHKPYVVLDENADIVEISGDINQFISLKPGNANINLLKLIKEDYVLELRTIILESVKHKTTVTGRVRRISHGEKDNLLRMMVTPLQFSKPGSPYFMAIFDVMELDAPFYSGNNTLNLQGESERRMEEIQYELQSNRQHMNTLVEELENSNEELQALNEELQSSNEEMQASNEELETSNEELQATNEELENAYVDLRTMTNQLTRQKQMMEQVTDACPDLIAVLRGEHLIFEFVNPAYEMLFPQLNPMGKSLVNLLPAFAENGYLKMIQQVRNENKLVQIDELALNYDYNDDGNETERFFKMSFAPLVNGDGPSSDIVVYAIDITDVVTDKKQAEENARFFSTLAGGMPQKVWTMDNNGQITYANDTFTDHYKDHKLVNIYSIIDLLEDEDAADYKIAMQQALVNKNHFKASYRLKNEKGNLWHLFDHRPLTDPEGTVYTWICTATDIQEEKDIESKKDEFMSIASHELKTPLTIIMGYMELLEEKIADKETEKAQVFVSRAFKALKKITSLVNDLLDVTRIETGKLRFSKKEVDFNAVITDAVDEFKPLITDHELIFKPSHSNAIIYADVLRITQVVNNLLSNAVKYSPKKSKVLITTKVENGLVRFEVTDHGKGIPNNKIDNIFHRFYRASDDGDFDSGLGIGLYISKEIIDRHQGSLHVKNNSKGASFWFLLPVSVK